MANWKEVKERWLPIVEKMEEHNAEDYAIPEIYRAAEKEIDPGCRARERRHMIERDRLRGRVWRLIRIGNEEREKRYRAERVNAALLEALEDTLVAIDMLCSHAGAAEVSVGVALSIVGAKEKATEAIRKHKGD